MNKIKFSIIIPTYHRNDLLAKCLDCLAPNSQALITDTYEVIVTDDGFKTTAKELLKNCYSWAKWIEGPRKGPAANRNNGAMNAQGEWLIFTDDDCLPDSDWLEAFQTGINSNPEIKVFEGKTYTNEPKQNLGNVAPINESGGYLWSCNFSIQRKLFIEMNGFDEDFPFAAMEDVDLRFRLAERSEKFVFLPKASVCHPWRLMGGWKSWKNHQNSTFIYLSKHPKELQKINCLYYINLIVRGFIREILPEILRGKVKGFKYIIVQYLFFFTMALKLLFLRFK